MVMVLKIYRLSHILSKIKVPFLPNILKGINFLLFHCVIPPECSIGKGTVLWHHGLGLIIHKNVEIGKDCNIYNHIVIGGGHDGAGGFPIKIKIGDRVNISAGAKILCKKDILIVGDDSTIAANAVVLDDVPSGVVVGGVPARIIKRKLSI